VPARSGSARGRSTQPTSASQGDTPLGLGTTWPPAQGVILGWGLGFLAPTRPLATGAVQGHPCQCRDCKVDWPHAKQSVVPTELKEQALRCRHKRPRNHLPQAKKKTTSRNRARGTGQRTARGSCRQERRVAPLARLADRGEKQLIAQVLCPPGTSKRSEPVSRPAEPLGSLAPIRLVSPCRIQLRHIHGIEPLPPPG